MPKMVCVQCQAELTPLKNGVIVVEMMWQGSRPAPYKIWQADLWKCARCDTRIVAGFAEKPLAVNHEPGFSDYLKQVLGFSGLWVLFDYESQDQREAGCLMGFRNSYSGGPILNLDQMDQLDLLLKR